MRLIARIASLIETLPMAFQVWQAMSLLRHISIELVNSGKSLGSLSMSIDPVVSSTDPFVQFLADSGYGLDWGSHEVRPPDGVLGALAYEYACRDDDLSLDCIVTYLTEIEEMLEHSLPDETVERVLSEVAA